MSSPNAAPTLNLAPETPPPQHPPEVIPGSNPWGEGHVHTADVGQMAKAKYNAFLAHDAGPGMDVVRQNDAAKAEKANYKQMGHEAWTIPGRPAATLGRMALKGETRGGTELGVWGRITAGIGAVALSPGALGYPITLAFRAATNANLGRKNIFKRVVPRKGEAPHELSDKTPSPYQPGYVPDSKPQPKIPKQPKAEKPPKLPRQPKAEKLPKGFDTPEAEEAPVIPAPRRRTLLDRIIPRTSGPETSPLPAPTSESDPVLAEAERLYPYPEWVKHAPNKADYDLPFGGGRVLQQADKADERRINERIRDRVRANRYAHVQAQRENTAQEEPVRLPAPRMTDEQLRTSITEAQRQIQALPDLSDESLATLPRIEGLPDATYDDILIVERARRERAAA